MCTVCLLPFISNPVPRVLRTGGPWGRAAANKGTKAPRHRTDTVLVRSLAGGISWCEGTALISAAEVWHSSPLPPQRRDIQTLPASCPGKIHWGGTRSKAASRWGHKTVSVVHKEKGLLSEHTANVEVSRSAPDDPGECCHAVPASVTGRNRFQADQQCLPHVCTPLSAHHS